MPAPISSIPGMPHDSTTRMVIISTLGDVLRPPCDMADTSTHLNTFSHDPSKYPGPEVSAMVPPTSVPDVALLKAIQGFQHFQISRCGGCS